MNKPLRLVYCGGNTVDNLGNGFLDLGAHCQLTQAAPGAEIVSVSNTAIEKRYFFGNAAGLRWPGSGARRSFDLRQQIADADGYVFTAACLCRSWMAINKPFIQWLAATKAPIIILGASGSDATSDEYCMKEVDEIAGILENLRLEVLISRDADTFKNFSRFARHAHEGVDCAFFLPDAYKPPRLKLPPFDIHTFDAMREPQRASTRRILRLGHKVSDVDSLSRYLRHPHRALGLAAHRDWLSECPPDYLMLYANCEETHSDRVHACVAALVYGRVARYYGASPRAKLFQTLLDSDIRSEAVRINLDRLAAKKTAQLAFLSDALVALRNERCIPS